MSEQWEGGSDARWRRFRARLVELWSAQGRTACEINGPYCTRRFEHVDHIQPLSKGGARYDVNNCRPACAACNLWRGNMGSVTQPQPRPVSTW